MQRRVASILSGYDDLINNNARRIKILEEMARLVYEEWFVKFRFLLVFRFALCHRRCKPQRQRTEFTTWWLVPPIDVRNVSSLTTASPQPGGDLLPGPQLGLPNST
jgi:hypothetical protein